MILSSISKHSIFPLSSFDPPRAVGSHNNNSRKSATNLSWRGLQEEQKQCNLNCSASSQVFLPMRMRIVILSNEATTKPYFFPSSFSPYTVAYKFPEI